MSTADRVTDILVSRHNGKRTGNQVKSNSPYRASSDGLSFVLTIADDEHGAWKDFSADTGGSLYELAEYLGIETPKRTDVDASLKAYTGLSDYAQHKGVSADVFERAKWTQVTHMNRPALQFPTASGIRYRFLDGNKPKFISEHGYKACLYGLKNAPTLAQSSNLPMILTNGEPSVIVAQHHGLPAVCKTSGETQLPAHILDELLNAWSGSFVIALDCDETGRNASQKIAKQFVDVGRVAIIVDLMLGNKGDLADFCKLHAESTVSAFTERVKVSNPYTPPDKTAEKIEALNQSLLDVKRAVQDAKPKELPKLIESAQATLDALALDTVAPLTMDSIQVLSSIGRMIELGFDGLKTGFFDVDRLIGGLPNGTVNYLYGVPGMGKSTVVASISANWEADKLTGCYVTTELKPERFMMKMVSILSNIPTKQLWSGYLKPDENERQRHAINLLGRNKSKFINAISPSMAQLKSQVRNAVDAGASFVVVDSVSKLALANDYTATANANNVLLELARETNVPFLVTTQVTRDIDNRQDKIPRLSDAYGGAVIEQNAENAFAIYRHEYYVNRHMEEPDYVSYPQGTARLVYLKTREDEHEGKYTTLNYRGGMGFFNLAKDDF